MNNALNKAIKSKSGFWRDLPYTDSARKKLEAAKGPKGRDAVLKAHWNKTMKKNPKMGKIFGEYRSS